MALRPSTVLASLPFVLVFVAGCSSPSPAPSTETGSSQSALEGGDDGDDSGCGVVQLTALDFDTSTVTFAIGDGAPQTARLTADTFAKKAPLALFPTGPIRDLAVRWNSIIALFPTGPIRMGTLDTESGFGPVIFQMANQGANAKLKLNRDGSVRSFRPVP